MKFVKVSDIDANDDHTWDNVTLGPVTVVLALALAAQILFGLGCADVGDGDDVGDSGEEQVADAAPSVPRGGRVLPYKPGAPSVELSEQALSVVPGYLLTSSLVELGANDSALWPIRSASSRWDMVSRSACGWTATFKSQFLEGIVAMKIPENIHCSQGVYLGGQISCYNVSDGTFVKKAVCPHARVAKPIAYGLANGPAVYNTFDSRYTSLPTSIPPHRLVSGYYEAAPGMLRKILTCYYKLPVITIEMKP